MKRRALPLLALGLTACLGQETGPATSEIDQASTVCLPSGPFCGATAPPVTPYTGAIPTLTEPYQGYLFYDCDGSFYGAVGDTKAGKITWNVDVTKGVGDYFTRVAFATSGTSSGATRSVVKVPTPPHPHCPTISELLYWLRGAQDLQATVPQANATCN